MKMRRIFCGVDTGYDVFVKRQCGSCERTAKFGAEEMLELLRERREKLRGRKIRERREKLRGGK